MRRLPLKKVGSAVIALAICGAAASGPDWADLTSQASNQTDRFGPWAEVPADRSDAFFRRLSDAALERTNHTVRYDPKYLKIAYPMGDVPADIGVCTDEVIRSYRSLGVDLQQLVHEDMRKSFSAYPKNWGQTSPDTNIDHRRVPNLSTFFDRQKSARPITENPSDYQPGDLVVWLLPWGQYHIGLVTHRVSSDGKRPLIVHNIGAGPKLEDALFIAKITGHYRYRPV